ncbi:unnamed protein product [Nesidiocoris tenuis]|nr:unnamed protein product [Nesidiocoris tenuis]
MDGGQGQQPPVVMIKDIRPGMKNLTMTVIVLDIGPPVLVKDREIATQIFNIDRDSHGCLLRSHARREVRRDSRRRPNSRAQACRGPATVFVPPATLRLFRRTRVTPEALRQNARASRGTYCLESRIYHQPIISHTFDDSRLVLFQAIHKLRTRCIHKNLDLFVHHNGATYQANLMPFRPKCTQRRSSSGLQRQQSG